MLKLLFSSSTRVDLLSLLLNRPEQQFYIREIAELLKKNPSGIKRELDNLEDMGIVMSKKVANLKYFQADIESPLYAELKNLITKSLGLMGALKAVIKASGAKAAFIYGGYAEGNDGEEIKLFVVGEELSLAKELREINRRFNQKIQCKEMEEEEYLIKKKRGDTSLKRILKSKRINLVGRL